MNTRNVSLDYLKGLSIVVVVFLHVWRGMAAAGLLGGVDPQVVSAFSSAGTVISMPAFFFVSGVLYGATLERKHGMREFSAKFDALFYPYLIWSIIVGVSEVVGAGYSNRPAEIYSLYDILWEPHGIFWFLYTLLASFAITEVLVFVFGVQRARYVAVGVGILFLCIFTTDPMPFSIPEILKSYIYMALGILVPIRYVSRTKPSAGLALVFLAAMLAILYISHMPMDVKSHSFRSVTPNAAWVALLVLPLFVGFVSCLNPARMGWLARLGERSLDIYLIHIMIIAPIRIVLQKFAGVESIAVYLVVGILGGVIGSLLLADLIRRVGANWLFKPPGSLSLRQRLA
jgi:fucose 4-O-acetylase-like acetyltransferase